MEWTRGPRIGRGSTATVDLASDRVSGAVFAVKSTELSRSSFLRNEDSVLSRIASPWIVKRLGSSRTTENGVPMYNLHVEYVRNGSLYDKIRRRKLDELTVKLYTRQILQGLRDLHRFGFVHCDVKSRNVLIGEDGTKIADLGCARLVGEDSPEILRGFAGTPAFMSPEVARGERQGFPADVWALGCTVVEMITGESPWPEMRDYSVVSALYRIGYSESSPEIPGGISKDGEDFLAKCLERDWQKRWSVEELLCHRFLRRDREFTEKTNSPSSVLDKGLWDFIEASDQSEQEFGSRQCSSPSSSNSAEERFKLLIGAQRFTDPNLTDDDDAGVWLTVRSNEEAQNFPETFQEDHEDGVFDRFNFDDELLIDYSHEVISNVVSEGAFEIQCDHMDSLNEMPIVCFPNFNLNIFIFTLATTKILTIFV